MRTHVGIALVLAAAGCAALGGEAGEGPAGASTAPSTKPLALKHVKVDFPARKVIVDAEVCLREGPLEHLLCKWSTKEHESILRTRALPSHVHFGLVALGLAPGKPARWIPGLEGTEGRLLPPRGARLKIALHWTGADGKARQADAGEWLTPVAKGARPKEWVFVGSDLLPGNRYWADAEGDLICVANFPSAVIDVPFESSSKSALLEFKANAKAIPKIGTAVQVVITALPCARKAEHARVLLEIDRFGRYRVAGRPVAPDKLTEWAREYLNRHPKGQVVIRADARSLAWDTERAREELLFGGLRDVIEERLPLRGEMLPRSAEQKGPALKTWAEKFANAQDLLSDPAEDAEAVLEQVQFQIREIEQLRKVWLDYAARLREMTAAYKASTQPSRPEASKTPE